MTEPVEYFELSANSPDQYRRRGSWADVLEAIPYFLLPRAPIPPRQVVNEVLSTAELDAGMSGGCVWPSMELTEEEYEEVVQELLAKPGKQYQRLEPPPWVKTADDYRYWMVEVSRGVPAAEHRAYSQRLTRLLERMGEAQKRGNERSAQSLKQQYDQLSRERQEFFGRHDLWKQDPPPGITM